MKVIKLRESKLRHTYPYSNRDAEIQFEQSEDFAEGAQRALAENPDIHRLVLAVPQQDLDAIAHAEDGGFRFVVDVETRDLEELSLMVFEDATITTQPSEVSEMELK